MSGERCRSLDSLLSQLFYWYALRVYRYRWLFLIVPLIGAGLSATGLYFMKAQARNETYYVFTPVDAQAWREFRILDEHWPLISDKYFPGKYYQMKARAEILIQADDGGSLLRDEYLREVQTLNDRIIYNFTVPSYDGRLNITYTEICLNWEGQCYLNEQLNLLQNSEKIGNFVTVAYPITRQGDTPFYLASTVAGVHMVDDNGRFDSVRTMRLIYALKERPKPNNIYGLQWMYGLQDYVINYQSKLLRLGLNHVDTLNQGLTESANRLTPKFAITFLLLMVFSTVCSFVVQRNVPDGQRTLLPTVDWVRSKPGLAFVGVIGASLATVTALGVMLLFGREFSNIVCVMPFLVLSIGINDMSICVHAWHRTSSKAIPEIRLAEMLRESAVAVTITSFTDVVSFAIGTWSSLPAVILFCSYTSLALFFEYIYQMTLFTAAFAFYANAEAEGKHCVLLHRKAVQPSPKNNCFERYFLQGSIPSTIDEKQENEDRETPIMKFFRVHYAPKLLSPIGRLTTAIGYVIYIGFALWGCWRIREGLEFKNLVHRDHYMIRYIEMLPDFWQQGMQVQVVVNNPPDLMQSSERERLFGMVGRFENVSHCMGPTATMFFLNEYVRYLDDLNAELADTVDLWHKGLRRWIKHTGGRPLWETDIRWRNDSLDDDAPMEAFRLQIGLKQFSTPDDHRGALTEMRRVAAEFPDYNVTTFHEYWPFGDQYMIIRPTIVQDNLIAVLSMLCIALVFIPNVICGFFIVLAMLSINVGIYGYMTWWGVNLDSVSMITLIMAVGFAIDYSAHISYGYVAAAEGSTSTQRTIAALKTLGWPVFQGATATVIGTLVLATIDAYLVQTFFKTVFLTIVLGLLHSVVFLPCALSVMLPDSGSYFHRYQKRLQKLIDNRARLFAKFKPTSKTASSSDNQTKVG